MIIQGKTWKYGDNIDTDVIIPGRYCHLTDHVELAKHCLEDLDEQFAKKVGQGDVIVAGSNFGCGSSRELAPITIKAAGVSAVIAESFARIFFRNSINIGLPIFESPEAAKAIEQGQSVQIDVEKGEITNSATGKKYKSTALPKEIRQIISNGGLMKHIEKKLAQNPAN